MTKVYVVQMQDLGGHWFDLHLGVCEKLSQARRKAQTRRRLNREKIYLRPCAVRIIERVETEVEE